MLQPDVPTFLARLLGASWGAIVHECMAYLTEQSAVAACTIRTETQIMGLSCDLVQGRDRLVQAFSSFLATISVPNDPTGAISYSYGPPRGLRWRDMLLDLCRGVISFSHPREELMNPGREEEDLREIAQLSFPSQDGMRGFLKGARRSMEPHTLGTCFAHLPEHADRSFHAGHEGLFRLGKVARTARTFVKDPATMMLRGIGRVILQDSRVARWALAL